MPKLGILTGGGDCPGLNPAIRAIIRSANRKNWEVLGFKKGWKGVLENLTLPLNMDRVDELLYRGGTILGSSRTNPYKEENAAARVKKSLDHNGLDGLIAIGGEDTLGVAAKLAKEGLPVVGLPKTIDNDLDMTDFTLGFQTAVQTACEAMDRIRTTAESHERILIVEIMGRHAGWLAAYSGMAAGADAILVPEFPMKIQDILSVISSCEERGKMYCIIAVAEGAKVLDENGGELKSHSEHAVDSFGHVQLGGIADLLQSVLKEKTQREIRTTSLGHIQRGGSPIAYDRVISTAYGMHAFDLLERKEYGKMPAFFHGTFQTVLLSDAVKRLKTLDSSFYEMTKRFFG